MAAPRGTKLKIVASGSDADRALHALGGLIMKGFDEE
ncbi:MAG: HPr family phosphocarrier protein [Victivallales bacterium]